MIKKGGCIVFMEQHFREKVWNFGNDFAKNIVIFSVDDILSSHDDNCKNDCSLPGGGPTNGITGSFGAEKKFSINFSKVSAKFFLSWDYNDDNSYLFVNGKKSVSLKPIMKMLGSIPNGFAVTESREVSLKGNVYDFSVGYNGIDKSDILNIHKYLMVKNNIIK